MKVENSKRCELVWDGGGEVQIPESMGKPKEGQLVGTPLEQLGELACRVCYDSLGVGRPSADLHKHILEVDNTSVYSHCCFVLRFYRPHRKSAFLRNFIGRLGVRVQQEQNLTDVHVNFRSVLEWGRWTTRTNMGQDYDWVRRVFEHYGHILAPQIFPEPKSIISIHPFDSVILLEPIIEDHRVISLWLYGSRGMMMEQNRHQTAISQRSTRYVDESESEYVIHPIIRQILQSSNELDPITENFSRMLEALHIEIDFNETQISGLLKLAETVDKMTYKYLVEKIERYLTQKNLGKTDARKIGRGAARGNLGNALATEGIYTTSVAHWKWILQKRLNRFADAEIRAVYEEVLTVFKGCRYRDMFENYEMVPSPDGIGMVLNENVLRETGELIEPNYLRK